MTPILCSINNIYVFSKMHSMNLFASSSSVKKPVWQSSVFSLYITTQNVSNDDTLAFMHHPPDVRAVFSDVSDHCFGIPILFGFVTVLHSNDFVVFVEFIKLYKVTLSDVIPQKFRLKLVFLDFFCSPCIINCK